MNSNSVALQPAGLLPGLPARTCLLVQSPLTPQPAGLHSPATPFTTCCSGPLLAATCSSSCWRTLFVRPHTWLRWQACTTASGEHCWAVHPTQLALWWVRVALQSLTCFSSCPAMLLHSATFPCQVRGRRRHQFQAALKHHLEHLQTVPLCTPCQVGGRRRHRLQTARLLPQAACAGALCVCQPGGPGAPARRVCPRQGGAAAKRGCSTVCCACVLQLWA